jgi:hypothetical protein
MTDNATILRERAERIVEYLQWNHAVEGEPAFVAIFCNACGEEVVASNVNELVPQIADWALDGDYTRGIDYCPRCR